MRIRISNASLLVLQFYNDDGLACVRHRRVLPGETFKVGESYEYADTTVFELVGLGWVELGRAAWRVVSLAGRYEKAYLN